MENKKRIIELLSATDEKVLLYFVNMAIKEIRNKKYLIIFNKIKRELEKGYADKSPREIWIEETGNLISFPFGQTMEYYYTCYYGVFAQELGKYVPQFNLKIKSEFHRHKPELKRTLESRKETIRRLQEEP